jgi:hypothetical protein
MNYMLLVYLEENAPMEPGERPVKGCDGLAERLMESGQYVSGGILQSTQCATSVRVREGRHLVTDGPFAETREQLAGYLMVDAENLDEAIAVAVQHPVARFGTVEIRPVKSVAVGPPQTVGRL